MEGIEIKTDRRDWQKELKAPEKADVIFRYMDKWWLCAPEGVAKLDEIPSTWGWLVPVEKDGEWVIKVAKEAPQNTTVIEPSRTFVASLLRSLQRDATDEKEVQRLINEAVNKALKSQLVATEAEATRRDAHAAEELKALKKSVINFEQASGLRVHDRWDPTSLREIAAAAHAVVHNKVMVKHALSAVKQLQHSTQSMTDQASAMVAALEKLADPKE